MSSEPDFTLTKKDFRIDWFSGTGGGGQHRNKHANCARITHIETGLTAVCQDHKDRPTNQKIAFQRLVEKLKPWLKEKTLGTREEVEQNQETVRTYNYPDNRVKDHASGLQQTIDKVEKSLDDMIDARREAKLKEQSFD